MYAVVDIETAGFGRNGNKITEIAIYVHDGNSVVDQFYTLINPYVKIPQTITGLTGITNKLLEGAPRFEEVAWKIANITEDLVFVAHNVNFDYNIIRDQLKAIGIEFKRKKLCTMRLAKDIIPGLTSYSLGGLCSHLDILLKNRHTATGDAAATVQLFERLRSLDETGERISHFLNQRSGEATLPPHLPGNIMDTLPDAAGVYYFHNEKGKIIYVGKAKQIKKRVLQHFTSRAEKEIRLSQETANVTYTTTGNELVALLLESAEIKRIFPKHNVAQRRTNKGYGIGMYEDRAEITHLIYNRANLIHAPLATVFSIQEARNLLGRLVEEYALCPRYCSIQQTNASCYHTEIDKCHGVCCGKEKPTEYNLRVAEAAHSLQITGDDFVILEKGRKPNEKAAILIKEGSYQGFGYYSTRKKPKSFEEFQAVITAKKDNRDVQAIIRQYLHSNASPAMFFPKA